MQKSMNEKTALLLALLGNVIFGFSFLFSKQALAVAAPFVLLAVRFSAAFIMMNCLALTGKFKLSLRGKDVKLLLFLGTLQPVLYFICESYGIRLLSTSFVGTIIALVPVACLVLGMLILREKVRPLQAVCALVSVAGVFLTTLGQDSGSFSWGGFGLLVGAVFVAAMFTVLSRKTSREFTAFERTYVMFALGCVTFVAIALIQCRGDIRGMLLTPLTDPGFWASVLFLAGASSVGAFLMLNYALTYLDVARVSIFANITTVVSILAGILILRESFGIYQALGSAIIIAGVYGVNRPVRRRGEPEREERPSDPEENGRKTSAGDGEGKR